MKGFVDRLADASLEGSVDQKCLKASESNLTDKRLAALYKLWLEKRGARPLPRRSDFDHHDVHPWMGNLYIFQFTPGNPPSLRATLVGTRLVYLLGTDFTGNVIPLTNEWQNTLFQPLFAAYRKQIPMTARTVRPGRPGLLHRLMLPCGSAEDGVTHILCAAYPDAALCAALGQESLYALFQEGKTALFPQQKQS